MFVPQVASNIFSFIRLFAIDAATTTTSTTTTTTAAPSPASIEDCPAADLMAWPYPWRVYGSKCYTLVSLGNQWDSAKRHCEGVMFYMT